MCLWRSKFSHLGSHGHCWAHHHGHEEGGPGWAGVSEEDLDGWFQRSHRQGASDQHYKRIPESKEPQQLFFFGIFEKQMLKVIKSKGRKKHQVLQLAILRFDFLSWSDVCLGIRAKNKKRRTTTDICFRSALSARSVLLVPPPPPLLHLLALSLLLLLLLASGVPPTLPSHLSSSHA